MTSKFEIHTSPAAVSLAGSGGDRPNGVKVDIQETSVRVVVEGGGRVESEIDTENIDGFQVERKWAHVRSVGDGRASVVMAEGKDKVTDEAVTYSREYGKQNPPSFLKRTAHIVQALFGSSDSRDYYGEDARHVPLPAYHQSALSKAEAIDRGRHNTMTTLIRRVLGLHRGVTFTPESFYAGNETREAFLTKAPANDPSIYMAGNVSGINQVLRSYDGRRAKEHKAAEEIVSRTNLSYKDALELVNSGIIESENGKIVRITQVGPAPAPPTPTGDEIGYYREGRPVSKGEFEAKKGKRR